jgi:hypothetical protein
VHFGCASQQLLQQLGASTIATVTDQIQYVIVGTQTVCCVKRWGYFRKCQHIRVAQALGVVEIITLVSGQLVDARYAMSNVPVILVSTSQWHWCSQGMIAV